ncbi:MAG TPA: M24 family metallopeptidase [Bacillota bacterium]|nr:M24 family metallopeptidase [Bacillota bacterium]
MTEWKEKLLPLSQQAELINRWLAERLDQILPELMQRESIDMWLVLSRGEYHEDPVHKSLVPEPMLLARKLVFCLREDGGVDRLNIAKPVQGMSPGRGLDAIYRRAWDQGEVDEWACIARLVRERNPRTIGVNFSKDFAFADGITATEHVQLMEALGPEFTPRVKSAERLVLGWLERRSSSELAAYTGLNDIAHGIIREAFSSKVVHPGVTTPEQVAWWIRERIESLGLECWFQPTVDAQRQGLSGRTAGDAPILPGDLLHCDVGLRYLRLATDTQQNAYVLHPGETVAPAGLTQALKLGNQLQDILADNYVAGRTGNEIMQKTLADARAAGLKPQIYTHPIGFHGHGAGPIIGLYTKPGENIPGRGDYELFDDTCYAIELNIKADIPEWANQEIAMYLEQTAAFTGGRVIYLGGRQTELYLI